MNVQFRCIAPSQKDSMLVLLWVSSFMLTVITGCRPQATVDRIAEDHEIVAMNSAGKPASQIILSEGELEETAAVDLGTVFLIWDQPESRIISHQFELVNQLPVHVTLRKLGESCNCTSVELDQYELDPATTATIRFSFSPPFLRSRQCEAVYLEAASECGLRIPCTFVLCCNVCPRLEPIPLKRLLQKSCPAQEEVAAIEQLVATRQLVDETIVELQAESELPSLSIEVTRLSENVQGGIREQLWNVVVTASVSQIPHGESLPAIVTLHAGPHQFPLSVAFVRYYDIQPEPHRLFIQSRHGKGSARIKLVGDSPFTISTVRMSEPHLVVDITSDTEIASRERVVEFQFRELPQQGITNVSLLIDVDRDGHPTIVVPCYIMAASVPVDDSSNE